MAGDKWRLGPPILIAAATSFLLGATPATLVESNRLGVCTKTEVGLKGEGLYRPSPAPGSTKEENPKPLALRVETRLEFVERLLKAEGPAVRRVTRAASAINGEVRRSTGVLRAEVAMLLAEPRVEGVVVSSLGGPLTRAELELVQGPGDPLTLAALLSVRPVSAGDRWKVGESAVKGLTAYDTITVNGLEATLESIDDAKATASFKGEVRGSVLGADGTMTLNGTFTFDRAAGRISELSVDRDETRVAGPVEAGLEVKSTLKVRRSDFKTPKELSDEVLARFSTTPNPDRELLLLKLPGDKASLTIERAWHTYWDDARLTVLKRLEGDEAVAQCNLSLGPNAGEGRHQDVDQFREDVKKGLGARFSDFIGAGELPPDDDPAAGYRYKIGVQGKQGDVGVVWYYYLLAGPHGDQVLATFTLASSRFKAFGDNDERLASSIRWNTTAKEEKR